MIPMMIARNQFRKRGASAAALTPEDYEQAGRSSFGELLGSDLAFDGLFGLTQDTTRQAYYDGSWLRSTIDIGEIATGDPASTERCEVDTLNRLEPVISGSPRINLSFDCWIPSNYDATVDGVVTVGQIKVTGGDAPVQIMVHSSSNQLRARAINNVGAYVYTVLYEAAVGFRDRWVPMRIEGVWSKTTAGEFQVYVDDVLKLSRSGIATIPAGISDAEKAYPKVGAYRSGATGFASRGLVSIWHRNVDPVLNP